VQVQARVQFKREAFVSEKTDDWREDASMADYWNRNGLTELYRTTKAFNIDADAPGCACGSTRVRTASTANFY
jgi:hypothetical protein